MILLTSTNLVLTTWKFHNITQDIYLSLFLPKFDISFSSLILVNDSSLELELIVTQFLSIELELFQLLQLSLYDDSLIEYMLPSSLFLTPLLLLRLFSHSIDLSLKVASTTQFSFSGSSLVSSIPWTLLVSLVSSSFALLSCSLINPTIISPLSLLQFDYLDASFSL